MRMSPFTFVSSTVCSSSSVDSVNGVAAQCEARAVDEDVDAAERLDRRVDEARAAGRVGDVERSATASRRRAGRPGARLRRPSRPRR